MPRPVKGRRVCSLPENNRFGSLDASDKPDRTIIMSVDEFETIRLMDYEGMIQQECAKQMNVARTTVQRIYDNARRKIADCIVNNKVLLIEGGEYELCKDRTSGFRCGNCQRRRRGRNR